LWGYEKKKNRRKKLKGGRDGRKQGVEGLKK
jgi:hypothetical protein